MMWNAPNPYLSLLWMSQSPYWPTAPFSAPTPFPPAPLCRSEPETKDSLLQSARQPQPEESVCAAHATHLEALARAKLARKQKQQRKREREDNFEKKKQKKDRNLPSNIFRNFINALYEHPRPQKLIDAHRLRPQTSEASPLRAHKFLQKLKEVIRQGQSYIRPSTIQSLWDGNDLSPQESLLFRVLLSKFLKLQLPVLLATTTKMKKRQKTDYIKMGRKLLQQLISQTYV